MSIHELEPNKVSKISDYARKQAGEFPGGKIDRRTSSGKQTLQKRHEYNKKYSETEKSGLKSLKRNIAKRMKTQTDDGANLRGKANYFKHLDARARRRGEE